MSDVIRTADEKSVAATWHIELTCHCPACGQYVDLLEAPDFWDGRHLDLCEHHTERTKAVEVSCPLCAEDFTVETDY